MSSARKRSRRFPGWYELLMRPSSISRALATVAVAAATTALLSSAPAVADPDNRNTLDITLDCGADGTVDAVFTLSSADAFHVVGGSNFLWKSLDYVTPDGQTGRLERGVNGQGHDLVTCTYTGAVSGNEYVATGFFTP
jgi:hypothetical protein